MACITDTCGVGGWTGPLPGDPDNDLTLSANTYYAGIKVSWSYPVVNPHAVAYTAIYRGVTSVFAEAIELVRAGGSVYYDQLNPTIDTTYYYWIKVMSVNGTLADQLGPASAIARPRKTDTLESLTGEIDAGVLAQTLKTEIDKITLNYAELTQEIANRLASSTALSLAIADVQSGVAESLAFVDEEITLRIAGDAALVTAVNTVAAVNAENTAAILLEQTARVDADSALATQISTVAATTATNAAAILTEATARANADSALATTITSVNAATAATAAAAVATEVTARTNADSALASSITTVQSTLNGSISSVQTSMQTQINSVTGELDAIYTAKVDVDGMVGGFGIYGTATEVQAGFDVDQFWVGRTSADKVKPFIISGGIVYMDKARIKDADIDTLKIAGSAVTGLSVGTGGADGLGAGGSSTLCAAGVTMPSGSQGVVVTIAVSLSSASNSSQHLYIYRNGIAVSAVGISLLGGFASTHTYTYMDTSPIVGGATYTFIIYNPTSGPGSMVGATIDSSSIVVSGAKR